MPDKYIAAINLAKQAVGAVKNLDDWEKKIAFKIILTETMQFEKTLPRTRPTF